MVLRGFHQMQSAMCSCAIRRRRGICVSCSSPGLIGFADEHRVFEFQNDVIRPEVRPGNAAFQIIRPLGKNVRCEGMPADSPATGTALYRP